jgi:dihydrolipoamide dehydrogenase
MTKIVEVAVPDLGDYKDVPVIELLVKPGDSIAKDDSLIVLESDKATMEIPAPLAGTVKDLRLKVGDKVSTGAAILTLSVDADAAPATPTAPADPPAAAEHAEPARDVRTTPAPAPVTGDLHAEVLVLGAGPGGYTAAFRAADLGKKVILVERWPTLGGVCLNVGCIPSKALLHIAKVISEAHDARAAGIDFGKPRVDLAKLRQWKERIVGRLTKGLAGLAKQRNVEVVSGSGTFASAHTMRVESPGSSKTISFDHCIIAAGSESARIPGFPYDDKRLIDSTGALELAQVPKRMLVIGGGIIGLEMATVYDALGTKITVVELMDALIPGADPDLVLPLRKRIEKRYEKILLKTKVVKLEARAEGLQAQLEGDGSSSIDTFDAVLLAVGRRPNALAIDAQSAGVTVDERGFIPVDKQMRTNIAHIFAIGDVVGEPMLAHKATHEGKVAAEVIAGHKAFFDARTIPSVAYTDPEIAWMGITEPQAKAQAIDYEKAVFPWAASGRALSMGRSEGLTKLLFEKDSRRLLGAGIVGVNAGELIAEAVLALEMGAEAADIGLSIHPHPTLSETLYFAAEIAEGSITDLLLPKR